jgi:hypothetical protein
VRVGAGPNALTTRLLSTTLVNTLLDDVTGLPIGGAAGTLDIYAGGALLEQRAFTTSASGVYTVTLARLVDRDVQIAHAVAGYPKQFFDRSAEIGHAAPVRLTVGRTALTMRLLPPTTLNVTLLDDATGEPLRSAYGEVNVYANTAQIASALLWTDAAGKFTLQLPGIINGSVRIEYRFDGYLHQYNDRKLSFETADPVVVHSGPNEVTTRLLRMPTLTNRLVDDVSGQPLANRTGWMVMHWDGDWKEYEGFTTDANGVFTATFNSGASTYRTVPIGQPVFVEYQLIDGYLDQYYDRAIEPSQATPVRLHSGANSLTTRLVPETVLITTLLDNDTGEPLRNTKIRLAWGDVPLDAANGVSYTTDGDGRIVLPLGATAGAGYRIAFAVDGYPVQYHDRTTNFDRARQFALHPGTNTLTVQLARVPRLANTLVDDATGEPIRSATGTVWVYGIPDWPSGSYWFNTDENGSFKLDLDGLLILGDYVRLRYEVNGYPRQFHDRAATFGQAAPVLLRSGTNTLTIRLAKELAAGGSATGIVTPTSGGVVTNTVGLGTVALAFPAAAVTAPVTVTVETLAIAEPPPWLQPLGDGFVVEARSEAGASVTKFAQPFTLTVTYSGGGLDERSLRVAFWDTAAGRWIDLPTQIDHATNTLTATSDRAGRFGVFGAPAGRVFVPVASK